MMTTTWLPNDGNGLGGTNCTMQINSHNNNDSEAAAQIVSRSKSVSISSADTTTTTTTDVIATTITTVNTRAEEAQVRLMQKRKREKQQRNDVNCQFAKLLELLKLIEREAEEIGRQHEEENENNSYSTSAGCYASVSTIMALSASTGPTNRVDLIARTIIHLEHLNRTAKKQQAEIEELSNILEQTKQQRAREEVAAPFSLDASSTTLSTECKLVSSEL